MLAAMNIVGNPSSVHAEGRAARVLVEKARAQVAALVNARPEEVVFTSGGTEANNWVLGGAWEIIILSEIEHDSVRAAALRSKAHKFFIDVRRGRSEFDGPLGCIDPHHLHIIPDLHLDRALLVSVQIANNETGVIHHLREHVFCTREQGRVMHTDAVQAAGKIPVDFTALGVDFLSLSAHKIGGPKGVGALVIREGEQLTPLFGGGGQERRRRAGTENVIGIAGFGAAAEAAARDLPGLGHMAEMRDHLEREVKRVTPDAVIIAQDSPRLPNTSCIALPGRKSETLVIALDLAGIAVSAGSACSSGKVARSHVLDAMRLNEEIVSSAIRVSLGWSTTEQDIEAFLAAWALIAARWKLASILGRRPVH